MGRKDNSFFANFPAMTQGVDLVTTAVGEDGLVPAVETVKPAGLFQNVDSRPEIQMIGITEDDLGPDHAFQFVLVYGLDRSGGTYRHEDRCLDSAVRRLDQAGPGFGMEVFMFYRKIQRVYSFCRLAGNQSR